MVRSNKFNFDRVNGQTVFEENVAPFFLLVLLLRKYAVFSTSGNCLEGIAILWKDVRYNDYEVWEKFGILWKEFETYQGSKHNNLANMLII